MYHLLSLACDILRQNKPVALAVVLQQKGSAPRGAGSRLLADAKGLVAGSVGGGLAEAMVLDACQESLLTGKAKVVDFIMTGAIAAKSEMICGGTIKVLVEPIFPESLSFFEGLGRMLQNGAVLVTDITDLDHLKRFAIGAALSIGETMPQDILDKAIQLVDTKKECALLQNMDEHGYLLEYFVPPLRMIIAGGGHVSRPTAQIAALAGFQVTVLDDRPEYSVHDRFPWAVETRTVPDFANCFDGLALDNFTYVVIVTRGHLHDASVLRQALSTKAGYVGMIGSKRKRAEVYEALRRQGVSEEALQWVHCPIGLAIEAETPEEIAISIVAECIAHRRGNNA